MEHSATDLATSIRREAPHPHVVRVVAGEFTEGGDYTTWRAPRHDGLAADPHDRRVGAGRRTDRRGRHRRRRRGAAAARISGTTTAPRTAPGRSHSPTSIPAPSGCHCWTGPSRRAGSGSCTLRADIRPRVVAALRSCARSSTGSLPQSELFAMNALETALLWLDTQNPLRGRMDDRLLRVMEHIGADLAGDLSVEVLARIATLSPSRLTHLFTASLGIPPQRYVERERLTRAAQLLDLDRPRGRRDRPRRRLGRPALLLPQVLTAARAQSDRSPAAVARTDQYRIRYRRCVTPPSPVSTLSRSSSRCPEPRRSNSRRPSPRRTGIRWTSS